MDIQTLAGVAAAYFETARRDPTDEDTTYTRLKDGAPEWIRDMVHDAHGEFFPDDWRYDCIRAAVDFIADGGTEDESAEFADGHVDAYNGARLEWLGSNLRRASYVDQAVDELGGEGLDTFERIGLGQYEEAGEVFALVWRSLEEQADEQEEADED